ncbi:uncharacterized protein LOC132734327 [Ruditapes philippinarum]|uniref:uncharacterized protein LOC132734327 n=1 Tax=Ruditapes philippinarum TaxID=129788 RepID=UPI00295AF51F|nr:uncharacterized protein LOC132734327 [Ruditapes philippinarum]
MWDHGDCGVITPARMKRKYPNGLFSGSLYHTMGMFNRCSQQSTDTVYYHEPRHSPLLVNRHIALDLENAFHEDFKKSSAFHFRSQFNVQYSMAYLLYVSSAREVMTTDSMFDEMDTDKSGTVSVEEEMEFLNDKGISKASMTFLIDSTLQCSYSNTGKPGEKQQATII